MLKRFRTLAGLLAVLALVGAACGKKAAESSLSADQKAVKAAVEASAAAENAKNVDAFLALWTDKGLGEYDAGSREDLKAGKSDSFGAEKIELLDFPSIEVTGTTATATVDATVGEAQVAAAVFRVKFTAAKQADKWVFDGFEFVGSPPPASGTTVVDVKAVDYGFILGSSKAPQNFAFKFTNQGKEPHELTLYKAPDGVDLATAKAALEKVDGSELEDIPAGYKVDHLSFVEVGKSVDVTFKEPLAKGTYILACYLPEGGFGDDGPVNPDGKPHIQLGMINLLEIA